MAKATFGNHAALRVWPGDRERIRTFYRDVLGCQLNRELEDKDDFRIGEDYYISFLYGRPGGKEPDKGAVYAQAGAPGTGPSPLLSGSGRTSVPAGRSQRGPLEI